MLTIDMEICLPTEFEGDDLDTNFEDFTGAGPLSHKMEVINNSLTGLDGIIEASGRIPPARGTTKDRPEEPFYPQIETDDLILDLNIPQSDMDRFYNLPMEDERRRWQ